MNKPEPAAETPGARADTLLPDDGKSGDGRFEVAEEVSLDQQSDSARKVGEAPGGAAGDALAGTLKPPAPKP